jgi:hypothetical protein
MNDLFEVRKIAADEGLAAYDFEPSTTIDAGSWGTEDDCHNEWTCVLSMEDEDCNSQTCGFIVRFEPSTANVIEAYVGDPH